MSGDPAGPGHGSAPMSGPGPGSGDGRSALYWVVVNLGRRTWARPWVRRGALAAFPLLLLVLWLGRAFVNPGLVALRSRSPVLVLLGASLAVLVGLHARAGVRPGLRWGGTTALALGWLAVALSPVPLFHELMLYGCYLSMDRRELTSLPLTRHERIYPLSMVTRIVADRMTQSEVRLSPFEMHLDQGKLKWVAQKTPAGTVNQLSLEGVKGLVEVAASSVTVDIEHHVVDFGYGRDLPLIQDLSHYLLPQRLGLLDLFDKEIDREDLSFRRDEKGEWVMVVAVIDWDGIFPFALPRFGGVFVCPQRGKGEIRWVRPEEIESVPYLRGQNLVPESVTKVYAESWKFQRGLWGWIRNRGVTKITSIPEDTAQQPFTVWMDQVAGSSGLFQFFALEPEGTSAGLSQMLLFDPTGTRAVPTVYYFDFEARGIELVGPARIAETIKASDIHADWRHQGTGTFVIAESRPCIEDRGGTRVFQWFNSVITHQQGSGQPRVVLADPRSLEVRWLEPAQVQKLLDG